MERDSSKPSAGGVARVPVPPTQVQVGRSEEVRKLVQEEAHLVRAVPQMAQAPRRRRNPRRCMRCGRKKSGADHKSNASANSESYCTVPEANRVQHWRVPPGHNLGDTCTKEQQGATAREWRRICKENDHRDEGWEGWGNRY